MPRVGRVWSFIKEFSPDRSILDRLGTMNDDDDNGSVLYSDVPFENGWAEPTYALRCQSTPPPMKWKAQQCDRPLGHQGEHWFDDGMTRNPWTSDHMTWCGLDTDHTGCCWPNTMPDATRPEPADCGHERPFDAPSGLRCTRPPEHDGEHEGVFDGMYYRWTEETTIEKWEALLRTWHDNGVCGGHCKHCEPQPELTPYSICYVADPANHPTEVFCDLPYPHEGWHTGSDGVRRYSWPVEAPIDLNLSQWQNYQDQCGLPVLVSSVPAPPQTDGLNEAWWTHVSDDECDEIVSLQIRVAHSAVRLLDSTLVIVGTDPEADEQLRSDIREWVDYLDELKERYHA